MPLQAHNILPLTGWYDPYTGPSPHHPSLLPALPTFDHLPPSPIFREGIQDPAGAFIGSANIFRAGTEDVLQVHRIDEAWCPYIHALIVGRVSNITAMHSLLAWGWDYRVAKSLVSALLAEREVHVEVV